MTTTRRAAILAAMGTTAVMSAATAAQPVNPSGERCENCRFWLRTPLPSEGWCRRMPPADLHSPLGLSGGHPRTGPSAWCGEWKDTDDD